MAARRIAQENFDAVLQEKANRYHMDPSGEAAGEALQFKAQGKLKCLIWGRGQAVHLGLGQEDFSALRQTVQLLQSYVPYFLRGNLGSCIPYFLRGNEVSSGWEEGIVIAWSFSFPDTLRYLKKGS